MADAEEQKQGHQDAQKEYFRSRVSVFLQPIPEEILCRTEEIAASAELSVKSKVLDVATGTGALITHYLSMGVKPENILAIDLSEDMLRNARRRYPQVNFIVGDILDVDKLIEKAPSDWPRQFDAVFFNACFGNLFDPKMALEKTHSLLYSGGTIVISHPLGARFVKMLHDSDPAIVPHLLPDQNQLEEYGHELKMKLVEFINEDDFYLARFT